MIGWSVIRLFATSDLLLFFSAPQNAGKESSHEKRTALLTRRNSAARVSANQHLNSLVMAASTVVHIGFQDRGEKWVHEEEPAI